MAPGLDNMLPFSAFEKLNKNDIYHLYCEIHKANQWKDQIENHQRENGTQD